MARLIALPEGYNGQTPNEDGEIPGDTLAEAIRTARGRTLLPETTAGGRGDVTAAPRRDWEPMRLGADPPPGLVSLRQDVESSVLSCYGVPAALGPSGTVDGTAQRESMRRLWMTTIAPLASLIGEELSRVLERPVTVQHGQAGGLTDVASRARAVKQLTDAGVDLAEAMRRVGWGDGE